MRKRLLLILRIFLGGVFVYASVDKILHPDLFAQTIYRYQILPDILINATALMLPSIELVSGLFLIFGVFVPGSLFFIDLLLIIFMSALVFNLSRGLNIHCGCFSSTAEAVDLLTMIWTVLRDSFFLLIGIFLLIKMCLKKSGDLQKNELSHLT